MYIDDKFESISKYVMEFSLNRSHNTKEVEILRKKFYSRYGEYFKSENFEAKLNNLKDYLTGRWNKKMRGASRYEKVSDAINIYKSALSDFEKAYQINQLMSTNKLFEYIEPFVVVLFHNKFIKDAIMTYEFMKKYDDKLDLIRTDYKYFENYKACLQSYAFAKYVIESYLQYDGNELNGFLRHFGIRKDDFDFCVDVILEVDGELYNKYVIKTNNNYKNLLNSYINSFKEIEKGIKTGYLSDGTIFSLVEFWKIVPLKDNSTCNEILTVFKKDNLSLIIPAPGNFIRRIDKFLGVYLPDIRITVFDYLMKNRITNYSNVKLNDEFCHGNCVIDGVNVDSRANDIIIQYMLDNKLPMIRGVYREIMLLYVNGKLDNKQLVK